MKINIIGGGAIGLLLSYFLCKNGHEPIICTRTKKQADHINQNGLVYMDKFENKTILKVKAIPFNEISPDIQSSIVTVTQNAIHTLDCLFEDRFKHHSLLFLQNGISHLHMLEKMPQKQISVGVVEHGAMRESLSAVHHTGMGRIKISAYKGNDVSDWETVLSARDFPIEIEADWEGMLFKKLIMNASINPVTAILRIQNGLLLENPYALNMMDRLFSEAISALSLESEKAKLWKELLIICRNTSLNRSSMLKSIESGNQTEIDAITGEIIKRAETYNIEVPYSMFAYNAVKGLEWRG
jgi:2-dehydropantoate 2-reductase